MKIGIMSDIHSNLEALQVVLDDMAQEGVGKIVCLGDIVGYGANPNECVEKVKESGIVSVRGNHDEVAVTGDADRFNKYARAAVLWTADKLTAENRKFLKSLPYIISNDDFTIVHSAPGNPEKWEYITSIFEAAHHIYDHKLCFIGHLHRPMVFVADNEGEGLSYNKNTSLKRSGRRSGRESGIHHLNMIGCATTPIDKDKHYIINVGSVGQPRDGDPRASYGVYDTDASTFQLKRVCYDIKLAQQKIYDTKLPQRLAERLAEGF